MAARRKLNRAADFDTCQPPFVGAHFHQKGVYFDHDGAEVWDETCKTNEEREASIVRWEKKVEHAKRMREAQSAKLEKTLTGSAKIVPAPEEKPEEEGEQVEINLRLWAIGQQNQSISDIKKEIKNKHSRVVQSKDDAIDFLIEIGLVTAEEIGPPPEVA